MDSWSIFAVLITIIIGSYAHDHHDGDQSDHNHSSADIQAEPKMQGPNAEAYLYGTLSVAIVSIISLAGIIVIPFIKQKSAYNSTMLLFMSLAVGTMASDAVLHLIPETLGLHGHQAKNGSHAHDHEDEGKGDKPYLGKMLALLVTLYGLYLLEVIPQIASRIFKARRSVQDMSSPVNTISVSVKNPSNDAVIEMKTSHSDAGHGHGHSHGPSVIVGASTANICGMKPIAFVVVVSDALHNFADGLAIGAAFAKSLSAGLAVSIAVVCHELPHEIGDFAILLNSGMSVKKALFLNFISALTCFLGLYPGIVAGQQEGLRQWIFAAVAGGFLYVALVHMLREIRDYGSLPWCLSLVLQNVGLLLGFGIVFLLAIYEDTLGGEDE